MVARGHAKLITGEREQCSNNFIDNGEFYFAPIGNLLNKFLAMQAALSQPGSAEIISSWIILDGEIKGPDSNQETAGSRTSQRRPESVALTVVPNCLTCITDFLDSEAFSKA